MKKLITNLLFTMSPILVAGLVNVDNWLSGGILIMISWQLVLHVINSKEMTRDNRMLAMITMIYGTAPMIVMYFLMCLYHFRLLNIAPDISRVNQDLMAFIMMTYLLIMGVLCLKIQDRRKPANCKG